jgi:hypothetical protein
MKIFQTLGIELQIRKYNVKFNHVFLEGDLKMETTKEVSTGAFASSLKRNNQKIREDRAITIIETTEMLYKRSIEDTEVRLKQLKRDQENMLDLSPSTADSLRLASDFNAQEYVEKDLKLGVEIRNLEIKLEVAKKRYAYLFGGS